MVQTVPPVRRQTFRKLERLASRKLIEHLVEKGRSLNQPPFRLVWIKAELAIPYPVQIAFSVPKKNFKSAVDRNRIKRQMREVYRKNKGQVYTFLEGEGAKVALLLIFAGRTMPSFAETEQKIQLTLHRFVEDFQKHTG